MIYETPQPDEADLMVIAEIENLRRELSGYVAHKPRRWFGHLRRMSFARAVRGSNWIEGYRASLDDVLDTIDGEDPLDANAATRAAVSGYQDALTYVLQLTQQDSPVNETLLKSLHFMMTKHDLKISPGSYRQGDVWVEDESGERVYTAPAAEQIEPLMAELTESVNLNDDTPAMVRAAMAHLNFVMIHPFRDGNGRMARALQTMVLSGEGIVSPVFSSIEEYLGRNTDDYYAILSEVGAGVWRPEVSARPWIRFSLTAHYRQAWTLKRRVYETEHLYDSIDQLIREQGLPPRSVNALADAARGLRLRRAIYLRLVLLGEGDPLSDLTATRDLKALVDAGVLVATGQGRGRMYHGSDSLRQRWSEVRQSRPPKSEGDPYSR